jgi:hypothetical protein
MRRTLLPVFGQTIHRFSRGSVQLRLAGWLVLGLWLAAQTLCSAHCAGLGMKSGQSGHTCCATSAKAPASQQDSSHCPALKHVSVAAESESVAAPLPAWAPLAVFASDLFAMNAADLEPIPRLVAVSISPPRLRPEFFLGTFARSLAPPVSRA